MPPFKFVFRRPLSLFVLITLLLSMLPLLRSHAESGDLVASLETLGSSVAVRRVDSEQWLPITKESLVGVGDSIRTNATGRARITFFANGTDTELAPASELRIDSFTGTDAQYQLSVTVVVGQTTQRIAKLLDSGSSYTINSTGLELAVRGTVFDVRVESTGRSATLVKEGLLRTKSKDPSAKSADVPPGYGVRAETSKPLSDVVKADNFIQLDAALDGCESLVSTLGDVRLNVRTGPSLDFVRVGFLENNVRQHLIGQTATSKWYRLDFKGGFGWIYAPAVKLDSSCAGLRQFPDNFGPEDVTLFSGLDAEFNQALTPTPTLTP